MTAPSASRASAPGDPAAALLAIREPAERPYAGADWRARLDLLRRELARHPRVVVAYSGGVDSSVLLAVAHEQLGPNALGVIGVSDSYASRELELALAQASRLGARVETVTTGELADPAFASNSEARCYHCKRELFSKLALVAARERCDVVMDGTIADDLADWRPGRRAAAEGNVRSPLAELGFRKADVRAAAEALGLASAGKPASPCLASRIPYGTPITRDNLSQVERAEALLRELGFDELRVRHHGEIARIEVPSTQLARLAEPAVRERVVAGLRGLGFRWVTLDLEGLRSGSLNPAGLP
ncbi:MAG TPA: ATP-dependent sacrificial sulfur transferase LarE [Candidatus Eisenbacteria bacterium]|jgi:uncharacterized protein